MAQEEKATIETHIASLFSNPEGSEEEVTTDGSPVAAPEGEAEPEGQTLEEATAPPTEEEAADQADVVNLHQRIAAARLREINNLREQNRQLKQQQAEMNRWRSEIDQRIQQANEPALDPELLAADPALQYFTNRLDKLDQRLTQATSPPAGGIDPEVFQQSIEYAQESRNAFKAHTANWDDAYLWLREKVAKDNGYVNPGNQRDEFLNVTEAGAVMHWMESGQDPAAEIYERAIEAGWRPGMHVNGSQPQPLRNTSKVRRVKEVLGSPGLSSMRGDKAEGGQYISTQEFMRRYSHDQRIRLYQSPYGDEIHEQVASGRVDTSLLP